MGNVILWQRPNKPRGMAGEEYCTYPKILVMRQVAVDARGQNNRAEGIQVVTTILDPAVGGRAGDLYERRWAAELDIRSIKVTMRMDVLRCKTPGLVEKELRAHLLAYDLLRTVMAVATAGAGVEPRQVSFKGPSRWWRRSPRSSRRPGRPTGGGWPTRCWRPWRTTGSGTGRAGGSRGPGSGGPSTPPA